MDQPLAVSIDATGAGSVDVTAWVTNFPGQVWFLTASPAAVGTNVTSASGANWSNQWHWQNALVVNGNTESPVQLVLDLDDCLECAAYLHVESAQPHGRLCRGTVFLTVSATGAAPLSYQWQKNGTNLPGATTATLSFSPLTVSDAGDYRVIVSNVNDTLTGPWMELKVIAHPDLADFTPPPGEATRYSAQGNAVIGRNQGRYFNRPLYINNTSAFVLTGDKPMAKFASGGNLHGKFLVGLIRGGATRWLHDCADIAAGFPTGPHDLADHRPGIPGTRRAARNHRADGQHRFRRACHGDRRAVRATSWCGLTAARRFPAAP